MKIRIHTKLWESAGILINLAYAILYLFDSALCWPFAIAGAAVYLNLCFTKKLFGESILQLFYICGALLAWTMPNYTINLNTRTVSFHILVLLITFACWIIIAILFKKQKGRLPFLDAFILTFSLAGTFYQLTYDPLNWWYFLITNSLSIFTFWKSGLKASIVLYLIYAGISLAGILR